VMQTKNHFDGSTFDPPLDQKRLSSQLQRVLVAMRDGAWRTLDEIGRATGDGSSASISARLRDLRKPRHGARSVLRRRRTAGLFEYQLVGSN
jgi:hypothetical protein